MGREAEIGSRFIAADNASVVNARHVRTRGKNGEMGALWRSPRRNASIIKASLVRSQRAPRPSSTSCLHPFDPVSGRQGEALTWRKAKSMLH